MGADCFKQDAADLLGVWGFIPKTPKGMRALKKAQPTFLFSGYFSPFASLKKNLENVGADCFKQDAADLLGVWGFIPKTPKGMRALKKAQPTFSRFFVSYLGPPTNQSRLPQERRPARTRGHKRKNRVCKGNLRLQK